MITKFIYFLNETYSNDKNEIRNFIDDLDDEITLYRGLIIPKDDDKINKDELGVHWSLDEYFVRNMFEYDTFRSNDDYYLYVITAIFKKSDIDIDGTINARFIKDSKHFWDELTGEFVENNDMIYHPYSHEDEILIKKESKPNIIDIEKIELS